LGTTVICTVATLQDVSAVLQYTNSIIHITHARK